MRILFLILSAFLTLALPLTSIAEEQQQPDRLVKIRLLPQTSQVKPGDEIWIGIEQSIAPHWHTYWINPGDSGTAPMATWSLPEGFEISEILWPTPEKISYGKLLNYGYNEKVILLQKLKVPADLPQGPITLNADIELLVCQDECIPEYGTYALTLNDPQMPVEDNSIYLTQAAKKLPRTVPWDATFSENENDFVLQIAAPGNLAQSINLGSLAFLPKDWGLLENAAKPQVLIKDGVLTLKQARGERDIDAVDELPGLITFEDMDGAAHSYELTAAYKMPQAPKTNTAAPGISIIQALLFALIGGLILNLMPCVFPVLSIKALSLVKIAQKHPELARKHGIAYTAGVILSFLLIAGTLIGLQASGAQIGWGFQLQNPFIVGLLAYLLFAIGLNFMGYFEVTASFANIGGRFTQNTGLSGSFATGVLATLVATPCTAPFMAGAVGFAFVQPPVIAMTVFAALGLGLALPYLVLSFAPALQKRLPKPGPWMEIFKQFLAFPMFIAALWLLWVLAQQTDTMGVTATLLGAVLIAFSIWMFKHIPAKALTHYMTRGVAVLALLTALTLLPQGAATEKPAVIAHDAYAFGEPYSSGALQDALKGPDPVFTEMTAAWCITCKVNHAVAINVESTKKLFAGNNVRYFIGDWTNEDPQITKYLEQYGRNGVPLYVVYGAPDPVTRERPEPKVLPQVLTPAIIGAAINNNL